MENSYLNETQRLDLITKLSNDDDFRAAFVSDPAGVLKESYSVELDEDDIPRTPIVLPTKQEFCDEFDNYVEYANVSLGCQKIHKFVYEPEED